MDQGQSQEVHQALRQPWADERWGSMAESMEPGWVLGNGGHQNHVWSVRNKRKHPWLVWLGGWSAACELKGHRFDSQSGHMPGLLASSPDGGVREATH